MQLKSHLKEFPFEPWHWFEGGVPHLPALLLIPHFSSVLSVSTTLHPPLLSLGTWTLLLSSWLLVQNLYVTQSTVQRRWSGHTHCNHKEMRIGGKCVLTKVKGEHLLWGCSGRGDIQQKLEIEGRWFCLFQQSQHLRGNGTLGGLEVQELGFGEAGYSTLWPPPRAFFLPHPQRRLQMMPRCSVARPLPWLHPSLLPRCFPVPGSGLGPWS